MNWLNMKVLEYLIPIVITPLAFVCAQRSKQAWEWINSKGATTKQVWAFAWAGLINAAVPLLGDGICKVSAATCTLPDVDWKFTITGLLMMFMHNKQTGR